MAIFSWGLFCYPVPGCLKNAHNTLWNEILSSTSSGVAKRDLIVNKWEPGAIPFDYGCLDPPSKSPKLNAQLCYPQGEIQKFALFHWLSLDTARVQLFPLWCLQASCLPQPTSCRGGFAPETGGRGRVQANCGPGSISRLGPGYPVDSVAINIAYCAAPDVPAAC
jgi:hypothetical protein